MISVDKSIVEKPKNLTYKSCLNAIDKVIETKTGKDITSIYNSKKVKEQLLELYNNKCAYCEQKISEGYSVRIDHFRPKDKVKDINYNEISRHNGYYWLGYEWTNLLPTCEKCNGKKSNLFPLKSESTRKYNPELQDEKIDLSKQLLNSEFLKDENTLLLNPEIDKVENYFIFLPTGEIKAVSVNGADIERGIVTRKVCDLDRDTLIIERKNKIDNIWEQLNKCLNDFFDDIEKESREEILKSKVKDIFTEMLNQTSPKKEYSRMYFFLIQKIDLFVFDKFSSIPRHKQIIIDLYDKFKNGEL